MSEAIDISDALVYSTIRIECKLQNGATSTGTGFIMYFASDGEKYIPALITNKHVIDSAVTGKIQFTLSDSDGKPTKELQGYQIGDAFHGSWIPHPDDSIDLAVMLLAGILEHAKKESKNLHFSPLDISIIPSDEEFQDMVTSDEVMMVGYPIGLWDSVNNMPVFRRGITATHPGLNWNGERRVFNRCRMLPRV